MQLDAGILPEDWEHGAFAARLETPEGPCAVALLDGKAFDMTPAFGTVSRWLNEPDPVGAVRARRRGHGARRFRGRRCRACWRRWTCRR